MTPLFDNFIKSIIEEGYFISGDDIISKIKNATKGRKVKFIKIHDAFEITIEKHNAAEALKNLKNSGLFCVYEYPVSDPAYIMVFKDMDAYKIFSKRYPTIVRGLVPYK